MSNKMLIFTDFHCGATDFSRSFLKINPNNETVICHNGDAYSTLSEYEDDEVVILTSNIFDWLRLMHKHPINSNQKVRNFDGFIKSTFTYNEIDIYKNPIEARTAKFNEYFNVLEKLGVEYSIVNHDLSRLNDFQEEIEIETEDLDNEDLDNLAEFLLEIDVELDKNNQDLQLYYKELIASFSEDQRSFILNHINKNLESKMGFVYG